MTLTPLPVTLAAAGTVVMLAETGEPTTALAGVLAAVVALLGWVVKRTQDAAERRDKANREEREKDREKDRAERAATFTAVRDLLAAERASRERGNDLIVQELRKVQKALQNLAPTN